MKQFALNITPEDLPQVREKMAQLGYTPNDILHEQIKELGIDIDCVYAYEDGDYEFHSHEGDLTPGYKNNPFTKLTLDEFLNL